MIKNSNTKFLLSCLVVILICSGIASYVQSDFGKVSVKSLKIPTQKGQHLVFDLYKPYTATKENKAPFVVVVPGFQR